MREAVCRHRWMWIGALVLPLAGCVRAGYRGSSDSAVFEARLSDVTPKDGEQGREAWTDRSTDRPPLDPLAPFGSPVLLTELGSPLEEDDPSLTENMLEIYFDRNGDIWHATRTSRSSPWSALQAVTALNTASNDTSPEVSGDGLVLFFSSDRPHPMAKGSLDIYLSTRAGPGSSWSTPAPVVELNTALDDESGGFTPDLLTMIFPSKRAGGQGGDDLYLSERDLRSLSWEPPKLLPELNSTIHDASPWLSPETLLVYFDRGPSGSTSVRDIMVATRGKAGAVFSTPTVVGGIDSSFRDSDPWLSLDLHTIYFASNRSGNKEIYIATR